MFASQWVVKLSKLVNQSNMCKDWSKLVN